MSLHPGFPVVEGRYHLTKVWTILLPGRFNRRLEEGSLVLWRPGMTIWLDIWNNDGQETKADRLAVIETGRSADATSIRRSERGGILYYAYRLDEQSADDRKPALYGFAFADRGHVQMAVYFDAENDLAAAEAICFSLNHDPVPPAD
jgi:hypothetical protein